MSSKLPERIFFDSFYIWFNKEKREEYYATPMYSYKNEIDTDYQNWTNEVTYNSKHINPKEEQGLKFPGNMYFPYVEKFGTMLLRFLNANLETFETAWETFFYAYGFEILKAVEKEYTFELKGKYANDKEYIAEMTKIYNVLKEYIKQIQEEYINAVDYIFNTQNLDDLKEYTASQRFAVYLIKRKGQLYKYNKNDNIIRDSYANKYDELMNKGEKELLESLKDNSMLVSMNDTHQSDDLSSICYAILEELLKTTNNPIKKCQNCGMYFIPTSRLDEIYCDYPKGRGKTCREQGAINAYTERLKQNKALAEYRRAYQQKSMAVGRNKENIQMRKEFDLWKKSAKEQVNKLKHGLSTEDEVYKWLLNNK